MNKFQHHLHIFVFFQSATTNAGKIFSNANYLHFMLDLVQPLEYETGLLNIVFHGWITQ